MKNRIMGFIFVMLVSLVCQGTFQLALAQDDANSVNQVTVLKGAGSMSKASGFAKFFYKPGRTPYQRFQVIAVGLKPGTDYQLFVNGVAFDIKKSTDSGSIEFLFTSTSKNGTNGSNSSMEDSLALPSEFSSVLSIENISLRERDLSVALIGDFNEMPAAQGSNSPDQVLSALNNITMEAGKTVTLFVPVTDPDGDPVTLSVSCDRGNFITVSGMSMIMSPAASDVGNYICSAKVTDIFGLSTRIPFALEVTAPNQPPSIAPIADQIVKTGEVKDIMLQASDPDGNAGLRFVVSQGPAFVLLSDRGDGSGILRIAPQLTDTTGGIITVKVVDAGGLTAESSFTVTVQKSITISAVTRAKPNLFISGIGFGQSGAKVSVNNQDISSRITGQSDNSITLKGSAKKLNLRPGANQITVTTGGNVSNVFVLNMLAE